MTGYVGLLKIELPDYTVRICDGGMFSFLGETYLSEDPLFGTFSSVEPMAEGVGDEIPALDLVLQPPEDAPLADLSRPGYQRSRVRFWLAQFNPATGAITAYEPMFDGQIDQTSLKVGRAVRELSMSIVSTAERFFEINNGNSLNPQFHKSVWPGETGHDNATGMGVPVAWGVEAAPRGATTYTRPRGY